MMVQLAKAFCPIAIVVFVALFFTVVMDTVLGLYLHANAAQLKLYCIS